MASTSLIELTADALRSAGAFVGDLIQPTVRLGITGLSRSGKTVFITMLVRNLLQGGRLPFFSAQAEGRIRRVWLEPQPDDDIPRFDYEGNLAALGRTPPTWPDSTRRISEIRLVIEYASRSRLRRMIAPYQTLTLDLVDYPGEWLIDLPLLALDYPAWAREALALARDPLRAVHAKPFLAFLAGIGTTAMPDEQVALEGARAFTAYLAAARAEAPALSTLSPGRFLMPGDHEGSPLLTFFPLDPDATSSAGSASLEALLARRYESYKTVLVRPFFRDHFSRLDRQIVLMDALAALNAGPAALSDLERALDAVLRAFRPGVNTWLSSILSRRIDRLLFAATKADHLHSTSHDRLEAVLRMLADRAIGRAEGAGARVGVLAMAALRSTREAEAKHGKTLLPCIVGVPLPGERIAGTYFDGTKEAAVFPGDLPADPRAAIEESAAMTSAERQMRFVRFRPPRVPPTGSAEADRPLPHIRLDRAIEFLIGDRLL